MVNEKNKLYDIHKFRTLKDLLNSFANFNDVPAFRFERKKNEIEDISYGRFYSEVVALGTALFNLNIKNCNVALIGENSYNWLLGYFGVVCGGNAIVPLDKDLSTEILNGLLLNSDCKAVIYSDDYKDAVEQLKDNNKIIKNYINMNDLDEFIQNGIKYIENGDRSYIDQQVLEDQLATIEYTSGTTGLSKGAMLTHKNLCINSYCGSQFIKYEDMTLIVLPLHHTFPIMASVLMPMHYKCTMYINSSMRNVQSDFLKAKPRIICLVPLFLETFYKNIWRSSEKKGKTEELKELIKISKEKLKQGIDERRKIFKSIIDNFGGNIEVIISGGAPLDKKYVEGFRDFGIEVINGYGLTECSPIVSINRVDDHADGSTGLILNCCEVKINNPNEDGIGEVFVKGESVMEGYYKNEQATKDIFEGNWLKTGDLGKFDEEGFLFITGRINNLIILSNGKNVSPEQLEFEIQSIPYIQEVLVSSKDNYLIATVFLDEKNYPDAKEKIDADFAKLNSTLPNYKKISKLNIREIEFEKTNTNKIKRGK